MNSSPNLRHGIRFGFCVILCLTLIVGCKKKKDPAPNNPETGLTPEEQARVELLSKTWSFDSKFGAITLDGNDIGSEFTGFSLTVKKDFSYSVANGSSTFKVWPTTGTWKFATNSDNTFDINRILRSDGVEISISLINTTDIILSFNYTNAGVLIKNNESNKVIGIEGQYIFSLNN